MALPTPVPFGLEFLVNTTTANAQSQPAITALADGRFVVAWADDSLSGGDTSGTAIRAQVFEADGTKSGVEFLVNTTTASPQSFPAITALSDGRFVVAWEDQSASGGDTSGTAIRAQVFDTDGTKSGGEVLVNTTTAGSQTDPTITELADGRIVLGWTDASASGGDTSSTAVRGHILDPRLAAADLNGTLAGDQFVGTRWGDDMAGFWGDDSLSGAAGDDDLWDEWGSDRLFGGAGHDHLDGGTGNDALTGGRGTDQLYGGTGRDKLSGGADADVFVFDTAIKSAALADRIQDFEKGLDEILLDSAIFARLGPEGGLDPSRFKVLGSGPLDANDRILYSETSGTIFYDPDGSGAQARVAFAVLIGSPGISAGDFLVA